MEVIFTWRIMLPEALKFLLLPNRRFLAKVFAKSAHKSIRLWNWVYGIYEKLLSNRESEYLNMDIVSNKIICVKSRVILNVSSLALWCCNYVRVKCPNSANNFFLVVYSNVNLCVYLYVGGCFYVGVVDSSSYAADIHRIEDQRAF